MERGSLVSVAAHSPLTIHKAGNSLIRGSHALKNQTDSGDVQSEEYEPIQQAPNLNLAAPERVEPSPMMNLAVPLRVEPLS